MPGLFKDAVVRATEYDLLPVSHRLSGVDGHCALDQKEPL